MTEKEMDFEIISKEKDYWQKIKKKTEDLILEGERNLKINRALLKFIEKELKNAH